MNPGVSEEVGSTLRSFITALSTQPALLAMIFVNFVILVFMYYGLQGAASSREKIIKAVLDNSNNIHTMLQQRSVACPEK